MLRQTKPHRLRSHASAVGLALVLAVVMFGTLRVCDWARDRLLAQSAEAAALTWIRGVEARAASSGSLDLQPALDAAKASGAVTAYRVLDPATGRPRFTSDGIAPEANGATPTALAHHVLRTGLPLVTGLADPALGTRVYAPLRLSNALLLVAEVRLDQRADAERIEHTLWLAALALGTLALVGGSVPLLVLQRRTRQKRDADAQADFYATHEPMTGLLNRLRFVEMLDAAVGEHERSGRMLAVLLVDLDGVKQVNEAFGHDVGDEVVIRVGRALQVVAGPGAIVARLGGDEFAVARLEAASTAEVEGLATALLEAVRAPMVLKGQEVAVSARIGIAMMPGDGQTVLRLMKGADLALDRARAKKEGGFVFFERTIENELQRRRELEAQLRETLANDAFDLHYQPLFETQSGRLTGFEALLRMPAGAGGFVSPAVFVPVAEEIGLITPIGDWVVRRACRDAKGWPEHLTVAVNLSPAQFKEGGVSGTVRGALDQSGLAPRRLHLEITEGLLLSDDAAITQELTDLKALGVSIVMDDFGTGYSSLSYLWKFPFDKIKIDRSFMKAFDADEGHVSNILQAIMSLSRALRMRVTAEGVETEAQAQFLKKLGCDEVQGYHFGRPMPLVDVAATVMRDVARQHAEPAAEGPAIRLIASS